MTNSVTHHHKLCPVCKQMAEYLRINRTQTVCSSCNPIKFHEEWRRQFPPRTTPQVVAAFNRQGDLFPKRRETLPTIQRPSKVK